MDRRYYHTDDVFPGRARLWLQGVRLLLEEAKEYRCPECGGSFTIHQSRCGPILWCVNCKEGCWLDVDIDAPVFNKPPKLLHPMPELLRRLPSRKQFNVE